MKICLLVRVYNRITDLDNCLNVIQSTWKSYNYYKVIISNGKQNGFIIPKNIIEKVDQCIQLDTNAGHIEGSSQLLVNGIKYIPEGCEFTIILEADTWIYSDNIIAKYVNLMKSNDAVWASARWYDKLYSLATDFAIIKTDFLLKNPLIFSFKEQPECFVANYLKHNNKNYLLIKENMPTMVPSYINKFPFAPHGRFNIFPKSKMLTYHIEDLSFGIEEKKMYFNMLSKVNFFNINNYKKTGTEKFRFKLKLSFIMVKFLPRKSWFNKRYSLKLLG